MNQLIDSLTSLSAQRDRLGLEFAMARLVSDVAEARVVNVHHLVEDGAVTRWLTRATCHRERGLSVLPLVEEKLGQQPLSTDWPEHFDCVRAPDGGLRRGPHGCVLVPLIAGPHCQTVIEVILDDDPDASTQRALASLSRFYFNLRSLVIENESDALTGLLNRKTFDGTFSKVAFGDADTAAVAEVGGDSAERRDQAASPRQHWLGVVDIDFFKRVNDTWGHLIGDEVLVLMAQLLRANFRAHDTIYRFGGEEFVVLMRTHDEGGALHAFERLRRATEAFDFPQVGTITISAGVTEIVPDDTPSSAFDRADQAVYWVKQNGRNGARSHEDLLREGHLAEENKAGGVDFF